MKSRLLQTVRWALIVLFSLLLLYLGYVGLTSVAALVVSGQANLGSFGTIFVTLFGIALLGLLPAIMLYSLVTRKMYGFASCIGTILALSLFYGVMLLPRAMGGVEFWAPNSASPEPLQVAIGIAVGLGGLILPFWILFRMIRLTNEWIYPRLLKPLEAKM